MSVKGMTAREQPTALTNTKKLQPVADIAAAGNLRRLQARLDTPLPYTHIKSQDAKAFCQYTLKSSCNCYN